MQFGGIGFCIFKNMMDLLVLVFVPSLGFGGTT